MSCDMSQAPSIVHTVLRCSRFDDVIRSISTILFSMNPLESLLFGLDYKKERVRDEPAEYSLIRSFWTCDEEKKAPEQEPST